MIVRLSKSQNAIVQYGCGICICVLKLLEKCLRYVHQNAYTVIAIRGVSFCPAARQVQDVISVVRRDLQAVQILLANAVDVAAINTIGDFVLFLAKCSVAAITGLVAALRFRVSMCVCHPHLHSGSTRVALLGGAVVSRGCARVVHRALLPLDLRDDHRHFVSLLRGRSRFRRSHGTRRIRRHRVQGTVDARSKKVMIVSV